MRPHHTVREVRFVTGGLRPHPSGLVSLTCESPSTLPGAQEASFEEHACQCCVIIITPLSVPLTGKKRLARPPWNSRLQKEDSKDPHRQSGPLWGSLNWGDEMADGGAVPRDVLPWGNWLRAELAKDAGRALKLRPDGAGCRGNDQIGGKCRARRTQG